MVVVLPTPPLPDVMTMARPMVLLLRCWWRGCAAACPGSARRRWCSPVTYAISALDAGRVAVGGARDLTRPMRSCCGSSRSARMKPTSWPMPACAVPRSRPSTTMLPSRADLGARVDVAEHDEVTRVIEDDARAHRADHDARLLGRGRGDRQVTRRGQRLDDRELRRLGHRLGHGRVGRRRGTCERHRGIYRRGRRDRRDHRCDRLGRRCCRCHRRGRRCRCCWLDCRRHRLDRRRRDRRRRDRRRHRRLERRSRRLCSRGHRLWCGPGGERGPRHRRAGVGGISPRRGRGRGRLSRPDLHDPQLEPRRDLVEPCEAPGGEHAIHADARVAPAKEPGGLLEPVRQRRRDCIHRGATVDEDLEPARSALQDRGRPRLRLWGLLPPFADLRRSRGCRAHLL